MEKTYAVEMLVNGEWKIWAKYEQSCMGYTPRERAENGFKVARCYGECRIVEL